MSFGPPHASSSTPSNQGANNASGNAPNKALIIKRIIGQQVEMGDAVQISGATDRESQIRLTLDRLKADKLKQAQLEADDLIRQAQAQIAAMLAQAQEKANTIVAEGNAAKEATLEEARQQGYAAGYQAGYDDGTQASETDTHAMLLSANVLLVRAYDAQKAVLANIAPQASQIMQALVERVVHHQLNHLTLEQWQHWYQCALQQLDTSSRYRLVVGTESYHRLQQFSKTLGQLVSAEAVSPGFERIKLELDAHLAAHEIYIIADEGMVDVSPDTQIDQYIAAITPDLLELEAIDSSEINPDDEEEQLDSLSQQLETILHSPLSAIQGHSHGQGHGERVALPQGVVIEGESEPEPDTFVPSPFEDEVGPMMASSVDEGSFAPDPFIPDTFTPDPCEAEPAALSPLEEDPLAGLVDVPEDLFSPAAELGQDALPFEFPSFDVEEPSFEVVKSPFEDEF